MLEDGVFPTPQQFLEMSGRKNIPDSCPVWVYYDDVFHKQGLNWHLMTWRGFKAKFTGLKHRNKAKPPVVLAYHSLDKPSPYFRPEPYFPKN